MVVVEERRRDLTLVDPYYPLWGPRHYDAVWPGNLPPEETDRRYGTSRDDFGITAAEKGPVYVWVVPVQSGIFYKLVPPERR